MVVTVEQGIPMNARGFFLRERDALNSQYNVKFKFPRGREFMHGNHQTMLMVGLQSDINKVMPQVRRILAEARDQYEGFKERQTRRRMASRQHPQIKTNATAPSKKETTISARKQNPFSLLDGLHEQEVAQNKAELASRIEKDRLREEKKAQKKRENEAVLNGTAPKPLPRPTVTMNYAAMAAKPKIVKEVKKVETKPAMKVIIVQKKPVVSWADEMSDEECDTNSFDDAWEKDWSNVDWCDM